MSRNDGFFANCWSLILFMLCLLFWGIYMSLLNDPTTCVKPNETLMSIMGVVTFFSGMIMFAQASTF